MNDEQRLVMLRAIQSGTRRRAQISNFDIHDHLWFVSNTDNHENIKNRNNPVISDEDGYLYRIGLKS